MAKHLDLEEQEQLDQFKHFWKQHGNWITWVLILVLGSYGGWNLYQYWQRQQATQAAALYDEVERAAQGTDTAKLERALGEMKDRFGSSSYGQQAGLLAAKSFYEQGKVDAAKAALAWVAEKAPDEGYQALARLRLAGLLVEAKTPDEALKQLSGNFPSEFAPLVADRKGDVHAIQGKKAEAIAEYTKAYRGLEERSEYRRMVEIKLNSLGVNPKADAAPASAATTGAKP
ncbi:MAG TPA: tetratricopeptide repeat protein [Burkholderiaceae bacterium]|nr:tetratricopeptide repeat protein [Burkholderiaceae bacterium]